MEERVYKYRMDLYYQLLVIYLLFFTSYVLIKGNLEKEFRLIFDDPIFYVLTLFILLFMVIVIVNLIRSKQLILKTDRVVLKNRFGSREIIMNEIQSVRVGRRKKRDGNHRIIKLKLLNRKKLLRIRANDFERGSELIKEFLKLKTSI